MAPALITPHGDGCVLTRPGVGTALLVPAVLGVWAWGGEGQEPFGPSLGFPVTFQLSFSPT